MWSNDIKSKYMFMFSLKNLARKELTHGSRCVAYVNVRSINHRYLTDCNKKCQDMSDSKSQYVFASWFRQYPLLSGLYRPSGSNAHNDLYLILNQNKLLKFSWLYVYNAPQFYSVLWKCLFDIEYSVLKNSIYRTSTMAYLFWSYCT